MARKKTKKVTGHDRERKVSPKQERLILALKKLRPKGRVKKQSMFDKVGT